MAGIVALAVFLWRYRRHAWATWLLAGLILLLPSSSLFPAADLSADRRMYLPMLGFAAAAGWLLTRVRTPALAAVVAVALTAVSVGRTHVWMTEERLWREAVRRAPEKVRPKIQWPARFPAAEALELLAGARTLAPYDPAVAAKPGRSCCRRASRQPRSRSSAARWRSIRWMPATSTTVAWRSTHSGKPRPRVRISRRALRIDPGLTEARQNLEKLPLPGGNLQV